VNTSKSLRKTSLLLAGLLAGLGALDHIGLNQDRALAGETVVPGQTRQDCAVSGAAAELNGASAAATRYDPALIGRGDRLKLAFYELLEPQDDKWGAERQRLEEPTKGIQLRAELSKEYLVGDDGAISLPILGTFSVEQKTPAEVRDQIESAFTAFLGRKGFVNITDVARQPIYVVGKVKNSGSFDYTPGMTVLHAIALAGGFDKTPIEQWQVAELSRESERVQESLDHASQMIARTVAIEEARASQPVTVPFELSELTGQETAVARINEELAPRRLQLQAFADAEKALKASAESAAWDLDLRKGRMSLFEQSVAMRQDRLAGLSKLAQAGLIARPVLLQAQSELEDVEDRRQEALMSIDVAKDRLNKAQQELRAHQSAAAIADEKDLLEARVEADKAVSDGNSAIAVMKATAAAALASPAAQDTKFIIIRRSNGGSSVIRASGTTLLEPGDLVQATSDANPSAIAAVEPN
jgi:protein involved in polysaccharide export with SLBB domain